MYGSRMWAGSVGVFVPIPASISFAFSKPTISMMGFPPARAVFVLSRGLFPFRTSCGVRGNVEWKKHEVLQDFTWSSVQVNLNSLSKKHTDANNEGPSLIMSAGDFTGGEFQLEDEVPVDLQGQVWSFDGRRVHSSREFQGTRITLIWFCHTSWRMASKEQTNQLRNLGFLLPGDTEVSEEIEGQPRGTRGAGNRYLENITERHTGICWNEEQTPRKRPVANLAFFEGIGSVAIALKRLSQDTCAHFSWETDAVLQDFLESRFPAIIQKGDASRVVTIELIAEMTRLDLPEDTLVLVTGGPPCVDHSRIKQKKHADQGKEGKKLLAFARLVNQLVQGLP